MSTYIYESQITRQFYSVRLTTFSCVSLRCFLIPPDIRYAAFTVTVRHRDRVIGLVKKDGLHMECLLLNFIDHTGNQEIIVCVYLHQASQISWWLIIITVHFDFSIENFYKNTPNIWPFLTFYVRFQTPESLNPWVQQCVWESWYSETDDPVLLLRYDKVARLLDNKKKAFFEWYTATSW